MQQVEEKGDRQAAWVRKGDKVVVIAGNDRGKTGKVLSRTEDRVLVQGVNLRKKHMKRSQVNPKGGVIDIERSIHASNVRLCSDDNKPIKVKLRVNAEGEKELYYKEGDREIVYRSLRKSK